MEIYIAKLVTPTITSELYEFNLLDLAQMYPAGAFTSVEKAVEWAQAQIDVANAETAVDLAAANMSAEEIEAESYKLLLSNDTDDGELFWIWTIAGEEDEHTSSEKFGYCLHVQKQELM